MSDVPTQAEMEEKIFGTPPTVVAEFYDKQILDVPASNEADKRIYKSRVYLHHKCVKENVEQHRPMQEVDQIRYPQAWEAYERSKDNELSGQIQDVSAPSIGAGFARSKAQSYQGG
jgi:hypothetical protein